MRKNVLPVCLFAALLVSAAPVMAEDYDLREYFLMSSGSYQVYDDDNDGIADWGTRFTWMGDYVLANDYDKDGAAWDLDGVEIWRRDVAGLSLVGSWEPGAPGVEYLNPPISFPDALSVGETVMWASLEDEIEDPPYGQEWVIGVLQIANEGVPVTTPAGTFPDCLEIRFVDLEQDVEGGAWWISTETNHYARFIGMVKSVGSEMQVGNPATYEEWTEKLVGYFVAP